MTGTVALTAKRTRLAFVIAIVVPLFAACISNRVTVDSSDGEVLAQAATLHVSLARVAEPATEKEADTETEGGTVADALSTTPDPTRDPTLGPPLDPALESTLRARAEEALRAKGYAIGSAAESDLILELAPRNESVARQTWSSDPDASGARIVKRPEAVLLLRARSRGESAVVWRGEARARLPESELVIGTDAEEVWSQVLAKALERVPDRRVPTRP